MNKWKFVSLTEGFQPIPVDSFMEAWDAMFKWIKDAVAQGQLDWQILETAIWIEQPNSKPLFFYDARDRAIDNGWTEPK